MSADRACIGELQDDFFMLSVICVRRGPLEVQDTELFDLHLLNVEETLLNLT